MRLFAAVPIGDPARDRLVGLLAALRATPWPVRWVRDDGLHLTLKFFGEVAPARVPSIEATLRAATADTPPLALELTELGTFPARGPVRVLWIGLDGPPGLELLQDRVERGAEAIGFPLAGRPFRPHVTLGRVRDGERLTPPALEEFAPRVASVPFTADRVVLYESTLGAGGARHQPRFTFDLG